MPDPREVIDLDADEIVLDTEAEGEAGTPAPDDGEGDA